MTFRELRESLGKTQSEMAEILDTSSVTISKWENGRSVPNMHSLFKMSTKLNVPLNALAEMFERNAKFYLS